MQRTRASSDIGVVDFFCGCGGTSAGLQRSGMRIDLGVDFDREAAATFRSNFPDADFVRADVRALSPERLMERLPAKNGLRLLSACAPCQPFSSLRRRISDKPRNRTLLLDLVPLLDTIDPDLILIENVPGLQAVKGHSTWRRFTKHLETVGFNPRWSVVNCQDFGVPQRRKRLILLGSRLGHVNFPTPTHGLGRAPLSTVGDWIDDLPALAAGEVHPQISNHRAGALGALSLERIRSTPEGGGRLDWPPELELKCHSEHRGHQDVYGRLRSDGLAPVLTTKCTSLSNGRFGHPSQDRAISVREAADLQTFPRTFEFVGGLRSTTRQVGNAVPVLLAEQLGAALQGHVERSKEPRSRRER